MKILTSIRIHITPRPRRNHISPQKHTSLVTSDIMSELGDQVGNVDATEEERTRQANEHQEKIKLAMQLIEQQALARADMLKQQTAMFAALGLAPGDLNNADTEHLHLSKKRKRNEDEVTETEEGDSSRNTLGGGHDYEHN